MSIKVMIADDHALVREGIKHLLEYDNSIEVIAEASDGYECIKKLMEITPDVLLLDINMPQLNGLEVLERLKKEHVYIKTLILTVHNEIEYLVKAIEIGASGYILKDSGSVELKQAINIIFEGDSYIQPSLLPALNSRLINKNDEKEKLKSLTKRELEILTQVASGMFNKEIAMSLNISERTVKNHLSNIFKKIDVSDRTQAAVFAIKNNIVKLY